MSLRRKKKNKHNGPTSNSEMKDVTPDVAMGPLSDSVSQVRIRNDSPSSRRSTGSDHSSVTPSLGRKSRRKKCEDIEMGIKNVEVVNECITIQTVEVLKRPGQTLGFYIREGDGENRKKGVFISRIAEGSIVKQNGLLKVGDEIQAINSVNVTRTNLDDVVVLMSIPKKLILTVKSLRQQYSQQRQLLENTNHEELKSECVQKQLSQESSEYSRHVVPPLDLNPEDSNDSGLSSEHSVRGERQHDYQSHYSNLLTQNPIPVSSPYSVNIEPVYARPKPPKSELYVSDGEHEYNYLSKMPSSQRSHARSECTRFPRHNAARSTTDAYNSDSELLPKCHQAVAEPEQTHYWRNMEYQNTHVADKPYSTLKPPSFSPQMQDWLRKYGTVAGKFPAKADQLEKISTTHELDGYRNELWRQEQLLNNAIHNMESVLTVDAMLQQSTHAGLAPTDSSPRTALPGGSSTSHNPSAASAYSYLRDLPSFVRSPMTLKTDNFTLYRPRPDYEKVIKSDVLPNGSMKLKIYSARGLKAAPKSLKDLYCVVQLDHVKQAKTMIRTGAINFDWDETFDMLIPDGTRNLHCMIYLWDPVLRHKLCYTNQICLADVINKTSYGPQNHKSALKLAPTGILYLEISYCRESPIISANGGKPSSVFGKPLKDVLAKQGTETTVPTIIQKCVSEIESRGMSVIGIYRVCAAAKKKQQLRQEMDCHPQLVDLSPSNVPEIHVITGLLKDYLRELPDPLIAAQAYHVVERAYTKYSTQDADLDSLEIVNEFVAKLQPWQQGTVVFLLNHLKRVSLFQNENKMTTESLSVCVGPILIPVKESTDSSEGDANTVKLHIPVIRYILDIWPQEYSTNNNVVV